MIKLFLQGAYSTTLARHRNNTAAWDAVLNAHALSQPYSVAPFNYPGTESVTSFPASTNSGTDILDWVLVELRDINGAVVDRKAAFVLCDGTVPVSFPSFADEAFYVAVFHRNHLAVRSSLLVALDSEGVPEYDFTTSQSQAYQDASIITTAMKEVSPGVFALWGGNASGMTENIPSAVRMSGGGTINDYLILHNTLGGDVKKILTNMYHPADMNMDGTVRMSGGGTINEYLFLVNSVLGGNTLQIIKRHL